VYSVGSESEAISLLTMACQINLAGEYVARELVEEQTLKNLFSFGKRLDQLHNSLIDQGRCDCVRP